MTHQIEITNALEQNTCKGQDQPFSGETATKKKYFGVWDGHGSNSVITKLREYASSGKLDEIMDKESPVQYISDELIREKVCKENESSGATMNFGIIDGNFITFINCGDSQMFVFFNGELKYKSAEHYWKNEKEKNRLKSKNVWYSPAINLKIVSPDELIGVYTEYVHYSNGQNLALTQAVGHNNITGLDPEIFKMEVFPTDEIIAVSVSDGVTDMLITDEEDNIIQNDIKMLRDLSAEQLKNTIQARLLQPWKMEAYQSNNPPQICSYTKEQCDDICVSRLVMKPFA
jgi:hypothetical protein